MKHSKKSLKSPLFTSVNLYLLTFIILLILAILIFISYKKFTGPKITEKKQGKIISGSFDKSKLKSEQVWKKILDPKQYHILREQGTEIPFSGKLNNEKRKGTYFSAGCNEPVFRSEQKYDSGTGWPSFYAPIDNDSLILQKDYSLGVERIEVLDKCGGHLGHVFDDGPLPTEKRYCMNSDALVFIADEGQ